ICTNSARMAYDPTSVDDSGPASVLSVLKSQIASLESLQLLQGSNSAIEDDAASILSTEIVLPKDVVCGVLHRGGKCSVGGASKSKKTFILQDLAVSVATDTAWLGNLQTSKGRVLYVNFELTRPHFNKRIQAICDERQAKIEPGMLTVWHLRGRIRD